MSKGYESLYGVLLGIILLSCSSLDNSMRNSYSIVEDTFDKKYIIDGVERYEQFPNRKSISNDAMRYSLRTEFVEDGDTIRWLNSIKISHVYFYDITKYDTTSIQIDKIELEESEYAILNYEDTYSNLYLGECCKVWDAIEILLPADYLDIIDRRRNMLVRLTDTNKRYEYILSITPEMIAMQELGLVALKKQLGLEKDDGKVNVIQQTGF